MTETEPQPSCMFKRRPRQQTKRGNKRSTGTPGPALRTQQCRNSNIPFRLLKMMTAKIWIFPPRLGRADSVDRSSKRSFHGCLTGLATQAPEEHAPLQRSSATSYEDRRLVPHACVPQMALPLGCVCGKCPDATRLHHQCAEKNWQQALVSADCVVPSGTHSWNTERLAAPPKPHEDTTLVFTPSWVDSNSQTQALRPNPEGSQQRNPGRLISLLPLLSQDSVRPWIVCVASPNAASA